MVGIKNDTQKASEDYLVQFLQISFSDVHNAISAQQEDHVTMDAIKETIESALFAQTKQGQDVTKKMNNKSPFKKQETMMSRTSSRW
jgi:hypothetical protein